MRSETLDALKKYEEAWQHSVSPRDLSLIRVSVALSSGSISFSELLQKTRISSRTLNKLLKEGTKQGVISKQRQKVFPWKSTYSFTEAAKLLKVTGKFIEMADTYNRVLIEGAGEGHASPEEIVEKVMNHRKHQWDLFFDMNQRWLEGIFFQYVRILFSAINSITFWGAFYTLSFPQVKKKANKIMLKKGMLSPSEEGLLRAILNKA